MATSAQTIAPSARAAPLPAEAATPAGSAQPAAAAGGGFASLMDQLGQSIAPADATASPAVNAPAGNLSPPGAPAVPNQPGPGAAQPAQLLIPTRVLASAAPAAKRGPTEADAPKPSTSKADTAVNDPANPPLDPALLPLPVPVPVPVATQSPTPSAPAANGGDALQTAGIAAARDASTEVATASVRSTPAGFRLADQAALPLQAGISDHPAGNGVATVATAAATASPQTTPAQTDRQPLGPTAPAPAITTTTAIPPSAAPLPHAAAPSPVRPSQLASARSAQPPTSSEPATASKPAADHAAAAAAPAADAPAPSASSLVPPTIGQSDAARSAPQPVAAATPVQSPVPSPAAQVAQAIVEPVKVLLTSPQADVTAPHVTTIQIMPAELGRVDVRIERVGDGPAKIQLVAERPETLSRLVHDQAQLAQSLDQAGVPQTGRTIEFSLAPPSTDAASSNPMGGNQMGDARSGNEFQRQSGYQANQNFGVVDDGPSVPAAYRQTVRSGIDITA